MLVNLFTHVGRITVDGLAPERFGVIANAEAANTRPGNVKHAMVHFIALKIHAVFLQGHCRKKDRNTKRERERDEIEVASNVSQKSAGVAFH